MSANSPPSTNPAEGIKIQPSRHPEAATGFHAARFDPAVNLTEDLPQGVDADVLLLGCGDPRDILYTSAANRLFPERRLDITACDADEHALG
jgi:hypothetical protein